MSETRQKLSLFTDCIYFPLDRPCALQKNNNMHCDRCPDYKKISQNKKTKILIVKLGAMGDVLRTSFILKGLKEKYSPCDIYWIVDKNNAAVLNGNELIDKIIPNDDNVEDFLLSTFFDFVINLDLSPKSLALTTLSLKKDIMGFGLDKDRKIVSSNTAAENWLLMSAYDELKKSNDKTYQYHMSKIIGLQQEKDEIIVPLKKDSVLKAEQFLKDKNTRTTSKIIGLNPGAGKRWKMKKWRIDGFINIAKHFSSKGHTVLLLGGQDEKEEIKSVLNENIENVFSTGTENSVSDFFAMINLCDIVVCGDTMALHAATGLKKNTVALFGPTSLAEIELYGRGTKLTSNKNCICCYRQECDKTNNCMDLISDKEVIEAVEKYI